MQARYPGIQPFSTQQSHLFFGREDDLSKLESHILFNRVSILQGKSGIGKSSIIHAGLIPRFQEKGFKVIPIRFTPLSQGEKVNPKVEFLAHLNAHINPEEEISELIDKVDFDESSLWHQIKKLQYAGKSLGDSDTNPQQLLLIFDQFEDFFTYHETSVFIEELASILHEKIPKRVQRSLRFLAKQEVEKFNSNILSIFQNPIQLRILFSIRSDKLSLLSRLRDHIPDIFDHAWEIQSMTRAKAFSAIVEPAQLEGEFQSPKFVYSIEATNKILDFLSQESNGEIEPFQLQMICQHLEDKLIRDNHSEDQKDILLEVEDIDDPKPLIQNYYESQVSKFEQEEVRQAVRKLIENELVFEPERRRLSLYEGQITNENIDAAILSELVDKRLLRIESTPNGSYYELSHDSLINPILKAKKLRLEKEEERENEHRLKELLEEKKKEQRKAIWKFAQQVFVYSLIIIILSSGFFIIYLRNLLHETKEVNTEIRSLNEEIAEAYQELGGVIEIETDTEGKPVKDLPSLILDANELVDENKEKISVYNQLTDSLENKLSKTKLSQKEILALIKDYKSKLEEISPQSIDESN